MRVDCILHIILAFQRWNIVLQILLNIIQMIRIIHDPGVIIQMLSIFEFIFEPGERISYTIVYAPSKDLDQPMQSDPSLRYPPENALDPWLLRLVFEDFDLIWVCTGHICSIVGSAVIRCISH